MLKEQEQYISLKKVMRFVNSRLSKNNRKRTELVLSLASSGTRGSVIAYPPGGKKRVRQNIRNQITELEGRIKELHLVKGFVLGAIQNV